MARQQRYQFNDIESCNMCGSPSNRHKIMGKRLDKSQGSNPSHKTGIAVTVCKCNRCGLIYSNPQPIPTDLQDQYGAPDNYWKKEYFETDDNYFSNEISTLIKLIDFKPGMKSLDIGAGIGKQMIALERKGFDTYGFEASKPFYERAISQMNISPAKLQMGMLEKIEYPENHFDFISFSAVLEHLYNPSDSINKAMKWLKSNGIIHIEVPSSDWLISKIINFFYRLRMTDYVGNLSPMHEPYHHFEFGLTSFREHAAIHDYDIAHYEYYVCETFMPKIADFILMPYMKWTNTGMQLCLWLRKK